MAGEIIDHIVGVVAAILIFIVAMGIFTQIIVSGLTYMGNQQVYLQTGELIDNIVFSTGTPSTWGQSFVAPPAFGLQWAGYSSFYLTPFGPVRMLPSGD